MILCCFFHSVFDKISRFYCTVHVCTVVRAPKLIQGFGVRVFRQQIFFLVEKKKEVLFFIYLENVLLNILHVCCSTALILPALHDK